MSCSPDLTISPSTFAVEELYFQLASIPSYAPALKITGWPSLAAQRAIVFALQPCNHTFLVNHRLKENLSEFLPPLSYQRAICRYLEKSVVDKQFHSAVSSIEEDGEYDDEFMEYCVKVISSSGNTINNGDESIGSGSSVSASGKSMLFSDEIEPDQIGYASYPVPFHETLRSNSQNAIRDSKFHPRIPILIKKTFHQVGTKVWGAGLFLAELFQYMAVQSNESDLQLWHKKTLFELGAGVGITGILLGRGLPSEYQPRKIVMTDCFDEVLKLMEFNISLLEKSSVENDMCDLVADYCDWSSDQTQLCEQFTQYNPDCIFAADCTYSEDLNLLLISLFELYLHKSDYANGNGSKIEAADVVGSGVFLPTFLLNSGVKFVLIACTIRHPDTFNHFQEHLKASSLLNVVDISDDAHQMIKVPLYLYDFRSSIRLFCITGKH